MLVPLDYEHEAVPGVVVLPLKTDVGPAPEEPDLQPGVVSARSIASDSSPDVPSSIAVTWLPSASTVVATRDLILAEPFRRLMVAVGQACD